MGAKEKAVKLLDYYRTIIRKADVYGNLVPEDEIHLAKQSSLIAVDEIIKTLNDDIQDINVIGNILLDLIDYWREIKIEIEKL